MDKETKPPFVPPKNKLISEEEVKKMTTLNRKVIDEIKVYYYLSSNNCYKIF